MLKDYQKIILQLLEQLELEISSLYKLFAQKFPTHKELWNDLSNDEINHSAYIKKLFSFTEEGLVFFDEKTTKTFTIKIIIDGIKTNYQKTESNQYSALNALAYSLSLEDSIIESKFYDFFSSDNQNIISLINTIKQETRQHATKIRKALEEEKSLRHK